jgi:HAD superfamily hydrolase (TIGR01450 family)
MAMDVGSGLRESDEALVDTHDVLLLDLDGVVYLADRVIAGAADALAGARAAGANVVFLTNNASRTPQAVADQLNGLGVTAAADEVMTSAVTAARRLAALLPAGSPVLVVGADALREAVTDAGLETVAGAQDGPRAVVQGFGPDVGWRILAEATLAVRAGATWIATNTDLTLPSPRGLLPGNGSLVGVVAAATGVAPEVIGKPQPGLFDAALAAVPGDRPLMVGDRLDTDIAGAHSAGMASMVVLSGVSRSIDVVLASEGSRPTYLGRDLTALGLRHPHVEQIGTTATCGAVSATLEAGRVRVSATGAAETPDGLDGLRAVASLAWSSGAAAVDDAAGGALGGGRRGFEQVLRDLGLEQP